MSRDHNASCNAGLSFLLPAMFFVLLCCQSRLLTPILMLQDTYAEWKKANADKAKMLETFQDKKVPSVEEMFKGIPEFDQVRLPCLQLSLVLLRQHGPSYDAMLRNCFAHTAWCGHRTRTSRPARPAPSSSTTSRTSCRSSSPALPISTAPTRTTSRPVATTVSHSSP
eukprot:1830923-Rhodomonas_salina.3